MMSITKTIEEKGTIELEIPTGFSANLYTKFLDKNNGASISFYIHQDVIEPSSSTKVNTFDYKIKIINEDTNITLFPTVDITIYGNEIQNMIDGRWQSTIGRGLKGNTLGIFGLGKQGLQVAEYA